MRIFRCARLLSTYACVRDRVYDAVYGFHMACECDVHLSLQMRWILLVCVMF